MTYIHFSELMEGSRNCIRNYCELKKDEEVLIVGDTYNCDPWLAEALAIAVGEAGGNATRMFLPPPKKWEDPWPSLALAAIFESNVAIRLGGRSVIHSGLRDMAKKKQGLFVIKGNITTRDQLASEYGRFPFQILQTIAAVGNERIRGKGMYRITAANGTDITVEVDIQKGIRGFADNIRKPGAKRPPYLDWPGATCGVFPVSGGGATHGVIVSQATHFSSIPEVKLTVKNGMVTQVEGGGSWGDNFRQNLGTYKDKKFTFHPGEGVNWIEEVMWGLHPKAPLERPLIPAPTSHLASRSPRVIHIATGGGYGSHHHYDVEVDDYTLTVDGETLVDKGHLLVLDDPKVKEVAKEFGDPDRLLKTM